jgi:hypothetical protein
MSEQKQIEEMAKDIAEAINHNSAVDVIRRGLICVNSEGVTRELYDEGYRKHTDRFLLKENGELIPLLPKQSEWISVEDRLPDCEWGAESKAVLFITKQGTMYTGYYGCGGIYRDRYFREYKNSTDGYDISFITHWMPLPEAPKMKGGEE